MSNQEDKCLRVTDSSVTEENPSRTHEIYVNDRPVSVTFKHGEDTVLPFEQGVKFIQDGFTVTEVNGGDFNLPAVATDNVSAQLAKDECVAKYTELTTSALKLRAAQKSGGEIYLEADEDDRENVIAFIVDEAPVVEPNPEEDGLRDEDEMEVDTGEPEAPADPHSPTATPNPDDQDGDGVDDELQARILNVLTGFEGTEFVPVDTEANGATIFKIVTEDPENHVQGTLHDLELLLAERQAQSGEAESGQAENPNPETRNGEDTAEDPAQ